MIRFSNDFFTLSEQGEHLVIIELSSKDATDKEFDEYMKLHQELLDTPKRAVTMYKAEKIKFMKAEHRIRMGKWTKDNAEKLAGKSLGVAFVVNSILGKIILNGIFMIQKPVFEYEIFSSEEKAMVWVNARIENAIQLA